MCLNGNQKDIWYTMCLNVIAIVVIHEKYVNKLIIEGVECIFYFTIDVNTSK